MGPGQGEMKFYLVNDSREMAPNRFGIMEPLEQSEQVSLTDIDMFLVPGVAYDREGWRLGMGGGYYDRALSRMRPESISIGVGYFFQLADSLPHDAFDQKVGLIVTEEGFINPSGGGSA